MDSSRKVPKWTHYQVPADDETPFVMSASSMGPMLMFEHDPGRHRVAVHLTREQLRRLALAAEYYLLFGLPKEQGR